MLVTIFAAIFVSIIVSIAVTMVQGLLLIVFLPLFVVEAVVVEAAPLFVVVAAEIVGAYWHGAAAWTATVYVGVGLVALSPLLLGSVLQPRRLPQLQQPQQLQLQVPPRVLNGYPVGTLAEVPSGAVFNGYPVGTLAEVPSSAVSRTAVHAAAQATREEATATGAGGEQPTKQQKHEQQAADKAVGEMLAPQAAKAKAEAKSRAGSRAMHSIHLGLTRLLRRKPRQRT